MRFTTAFLAFALLGAPMAASAHGNMKPQHGGIVQMSGETVFELVVKPTSVELYVSEDDEPVASSTATAKLTLTVVGKKTELPLVAGAGNGFVGAGIKLPKGAKVSVTVVDKASGAKTFTTYTLK
jgi:hypothetical protein